MTTGGRDGVGVAVRSSTKPEKLELTAAATRPIPPFATNRTPAPKATTARPNRSRNGSGRRRVRSTFRCELSRAGDGPRDLTLIGAGRPEDGGLGRTWDGRPPRRVVIV